jgi:hypothetical protein
MRSSTANARNAANSAVSTAQNFAGRNLIFHYCNIRVAVQREAMSRSDRECNRETRRYPGVRNACVGIAEKRWRGHLHAADADIAS